MNWKTLLVAASLCLSAGLTACNQTTTTPEAETSPKSAEPAGGSKPMESKAPEAGAKTDAKPEAGKSPAPGAKTDAKPEAGKSPEAPKKP
jgi:hypothetical protein